MNFLFIGIYALIRFFIRFSKQELTIKKQISYYIPAVLLGFFIGAFAFVPSVYGYLNNFRPSFSDPIPWFDLHDDFLFTSRVLIVPALFFLLAFSKKNCINLSHSYFLALYPVCFSSFIIVR